jgi:hypothetical protein
LEGDFPGRGPEKGANNNSNQQHRLENGQVQKQVRSRYNMNKTRKYLLSRLVDVKVHAILCDATDTSYCGFNGGMAGLQKA